MGKEIFFFNWVVDTFGNMTITHSCLRVAEKAPQERLTPRFLETDDVDSTHCRHLYDGLYASVKGRDLAI